MGVQDEMEADVISIPAERGLEVEEWIGSIADETPIQEEDGSAVLLLIPIRW
ncbi:hypothetical protein DPMN_175966 [Dreissena polymorpha]|uniref:Uncharacterized protein n=1 Tax=Dreissena polymorpha TaxID=45954 RepID=A0A9D4E935_DREPO|nr:hypothetical protein DPMN_175966 [Dreissena polymorpha]